MTSGTWLLHRESADALSTYRLALADHPAGHGRDAAGAYLRAVLGDRDPAALSDEQFLALLVETKRPQLFAESAIYGDGSDWNAAELALLGDLGCAVPVRIFDDGCHNDPTRHPEPIEGTLLFIPGALLRNGRGRKPADWEAVTCDGELDPARYRGLYRRRLLPLLRFADADAAARGQSALITIPGIGCGQFAGPFAGTLGEQIKDALVALLADEAERLPHLRLVYYDPYAECRNERYDFGALSLRVRPLLQGNADRPQLCAPASYAEPGDDLDGCRLYSLVAWDPVSWPGNDFWAGVRVTDDGVKAAASDLMRVITGVEGRYDAQACAYLPPRPYPTWEAVAQDQGTRLRVAGRLCVLS